MSKLDAFYNRYLSDGVEYRKFGELATIVRGASPRPIKDFITEDPNGINWIKIGDVTPGSKYITSTEERITEEGAKKSRLVKEGDFVLSNSMSFGRPYILKTRGCIHDGWLAISDFEDVFITDFLYHILSSNKYQQIMRQKAGAGGGVQNLNADIVRGIELPIVPIEVQEEIVRILDEYSEKNTQLISALSAELDARKVQYEYYRKNILEHLSEYIVELGSCCKFQNGFAFKSAKFKDSGLPIIRISNIQDSQISCSKMVFFDPNDYSEDLDRYLVRRGDIVIAMSGATTGKIATNQSETNYYTNQRVGKFVPEENKLLSEYLYFVLEANSEAILKMSEGGAQPNLSSEDIKKMAIPVPPIEVQKAIALQMGKFKDDSLQLRDCISSEIELRKAQFEYYRDKLLTFEETN